MIDTLGRSKPMQLQTWVWLIGMSDAPDERLLQWAQSFSAPPSLKLQGAHLDSEPYQPERRAIRLVADGKTVTIGLTPAPTCVNPVFELSRASKALERVELEGAPLSARTMPGTAERCGSTRRWFVLRN